MTTIKLPTLTDRDHQQLWSGLQGVAKSLCLSELAAHYTQRPILILTTSSQHAETLRAEIDFFNGAEKICQTFPDWETLPFDHFSPHQDIISERLALLATLPHKKNGIILANSATVMSRLLPTSYLNAHSLMLTLGDKFDLASMKTSLTQHGYRNVNQVMEHGEFAVRGSIIDLFPMGAKTPYRIELFDDEIETIRAFNPEDQRTIEKIEKVRLLPAREFPLTEEGVEQFRKNYRQCFSGNPLDSIIYQQVSNFEAAPGVEYYLPLFYQETSSFFNYLPKNTLIVLADNLFDNLQTFWHEVHERYEQLRYDVTRPLCEPSQLFLSPVEFFTEIKAYTQIKLTEKGNAHFSLRTTHAPELFIDHRAKAPLEKLAGYLAHASKEQRILFCSESTGRRETLLDLLKTIACSPKVYQSWQDFIAGDERIGMITAPIEYGIELTELKLSIITETQLFGKQVKQRSLQKSRGLDPNSMIRNLTELNLGAPVVHIDHGVGRYCGLKTIATDNIDAEYLTLEYADNDKIYVPVGSLHLISRYTGADSERAPLQKLGTKQWDKIKKKTQEQIHDVAAELLEVYSRREAATGFAFHIDKRELKKFSEGFLFEETQDQLKAIDDVIGDMAKPRCMDRLVCGDVGFGKTEVAMRAAFICAQNNKQVAVLVPTTLLASQHLQNFQDRFTDFAIKVSGISRMSGAKEQAITLGELATGKIDIIVGTHKLLSDQIKFKDLGLLIIDEEQRFGVRQKEKIKALRAHVDILTLTATPIPRTLNMALAGTRDLSIIATPPARRLSVKTFVHQENKALIREAILRETMRGGQVYFLHNDVATIQAQKERLQAIVPEARIEIAHGQMRERQLEHIMSDFYHHRFNVLVSTTIIESGIDIPSANTMIINRADRFGLAQLHQLRGRVGRSHHQAYTYLITPPAEAMTKDAQKRLQAITELGDLGIGFSLATYDLEIRGAGQLLGDEQSGQIHAVGFSLYMELLEEAVNTLKSGDNPTVSKPLHANTEIKLGFSALLPKEYVADVQVRLSFYKRLANCKTKEDMRGLKEELIDRFGLLPEAAQNLFSVSEIELIARKLGITKIEITSKYGYLHFDEKPMIDPEKIILLIQKQPKVYQLQGQDKLRFGQIAQTAEQRLSQLNELLAKISKPNQ